MGLLDHNGEFSCATTRVEVRLDGLNVECSRAQRANGLFHFFCGIGRPFMKVPVNDRSKNAKRMRGMKMVEWVEKK